MAVTNTHDLGITMPEGWKSFIRSSIDDGRVMIETVLQVSATEIRRVEFDKDTYNTEPEDVQTEVARRVERLARKYASKDFETWLSQWALKLPQNDRAMLKKIIEANPDISVPIV